MTGYTAGQTSRSGGEIELGAVGRALWRRKWWIVVPTVAVAAAALAGVSLVTPRYKSEARVLIEGRENVFLRPDAERQTAGSLIGDTEAIANQVQIALSRDVALDVIRKLKLADRPEFDPLLGGVSPLRSMLSLIGLAKDPFGVAPEDRALEVYYERLTVFAVDRSRVIVIDYQSPDPELAAAVANAVAESYLVRQQLAKQEQSRGASEWLAGEIDKLRVKVAEAEARVEAFRSNTNLLIGTNNTTLSSQQLGDLNAQLAAARGQKTDSETRARIVRDMLRKGEVNEVSDVVNSEVIRRLTDQRAAIRAQLAEQSATLLDAHPRIKELRAQIADIERQIRAEATGLVRVFEHDARIAEARVDALTADLEGMKRQAGLSNGQDVQLRALERESKAQRDVLESYLAKYREATARESIGNAPTVDARIISRASPSKTPYFPKKAPTVIVAALAMLLLSGGFIATGELLRAGAGGEVAPVRPQTPDETPAAASDMPVAAIADGARRLIATADRGRRFAVFAVGSGVTTNLAALTLARALSKSGRAVLIDLSPANPVLAAISVSSGTKGLGDMISGEASFRDAIGKDRLSRLHLVSMGNAGTPVETVVSSQRFTLIAEALARSYDYLVIDAGSSAEPVVTRIASLAPRAVLIAAAGYVRGAKQIEDRFKAAGFSDVTLVSEPAEMQKPGEAAAAA
jgi:uncharacterized protein involved in exopolysaccharide biosynthesis